MSEPIARVFRSLRCLPGRLRLARWSSGSPSISPLPAFDLATGDTSHRFDDLVVRERRRAPCLVPCLQQVDGHPGIDAVAEQMSGEAGDSPVAFAFGGDAAGNTSPFAS